MLSIQPVGYSFLLVDGVENRVRILFNGCCEDDDFVMFCHLVQELLAVRTDKTAVLSSTLDFSVMNEGLVHVQDECVLLVAF